MSRYIFQLQDKYNPLYTYTTVAVIFDSKTNEPVLFVDCIPNLYQRLGQFVCFAREEEAQDPKLKGHYFGLVLIDPLYYEIFIEKHHQYGEIMFLHELGHYKNGDYKVIKDRKTVNEERLSLIRAGKVQSIELAADSFAIKECGIEAFIEFIDFMIELRKKRIDDPGKELDIKEFELRKEAALREFGNK